MINIPTKICIFFLILIIIPFDLYSFVLYTSERNGQIQTAYWPYSKLPIKLIIDKNDISHLGFTGEEITRRCINPWQSVETSFINFEITGLTEHEITSESIVNENGEYYQSIYLPIKSNFVSDGDDSHEVVFDVDGSIIEEIFNVDSDSVIGVGIPFANEETGQVNDGFIILNVSIDLPVEVLEAGMTHEFGHFLGIAHTNITPNMLPDSTLPTMYYESFPVDDSLGKTLEADDIAALSTMYPANNFEENFGAIKGNIIDSDGSPMFGISVVAIKEDGSFAIGIMSGHLTGKGGDGEWLISGIPEGEYYLFVQPINGSNKVSNLRGANIGGIYTSIETSFESKFIPNIALSFDNESTPEIPTIVISDSATLFKVENGKTIEGITIVNNGEDVVNISQRDGSFPSIANGESWTSKTAPLPSTGFVIEEDDGGGCSISSNYRTTHLLPVLCVILGLFAIRRTAGSFS